MVTISPLSSLVSFGMMDQLKLLNCKCNISFALLTEDTQIRSDQKDRKNKSLCFLHCLFTIGKVLLQLEHHVSSHVPSFPSPIREYNKLTKQIDFDETTCYMYKPSTW